MKDKPQIGRKYLQNILDLEYKKHSQNSTIRKQQQIGRKWTKHLNSHNTNGT